MRLPIIIFSTLLLSYPVNVRNHKGVTLFEWGKYHDYLQKVFGDKKTHPTYQGDVKNGVPNGLGIIIYPNGDKYIGEWEDGKNTEKGQKLFLVENFLLENGLRISDRMINITITRQILFPTLKMVA